jgi:low affinity Fe/Cu permease
MPQSKVEILSNTVDTFGVILSFVWIANFKESLSMYILIATAISLTITVGIKIYNLFNSNEENKKV